MVKTVGKVSIQPSGQWVKANTYKKLQLVSNLGSSYLAIQPVPANTEIDNTSYWMMIASKGDKGNTGKSIQTITKTGTVGLVDTYTILYSDLTTSTFTVNNGNGVTNIVVEKTGTAGNVDTYTMTITMASGDPYVSTFTITNGEDGDVQASAIAEPYDPDEPYKVGNLLTYLGKQYYCIADAPAGTLPTNTTYFEEKSVADIVEMIRNGSIVTGHSEVADNLTPYSEDSGTTQENPFISQGTGTDNNSVIVTTGVIAKQLEKQGNTIAWNQLTPANRTSVSGTDTYSAQTFKTSDLTGIDSIIGHKYFISCNVTVSDSTAVIKVRVRNPFTSDYVNLSSNTKVPLVLVGEAVETDRVKLQFYKAGTEATDTTYSVTDVHIHDITSWNSSIITDLTSNPSHFSWYYNGSLSYDAGSLQNCNGRYLECGQGRNLFDQVTELGDIDSTTGADTSSSSLLRSKNFIPVVPNKPIYIYAGSGDYLRFRYYDANKNYIGALDTQGQGSGKNVIRYMLPNCYYMRFTTEYSYGTTYKNDISVEEYYTPAEGGEGYGEMHDYIPPIRIDTGNEELLAFDKKLPSGVITDNTLEKNLKDLTWGDVTYNSVRYFRARANNDFTRTSDLTNLIATCSPYSIVYGNTARRDLPSDGNITFWCTYAGSGYTVFVRDDSISTVEELVAKINGTLQVNRLEPITTQGTPYSEYADINDYSYMAWFDTDGNLVSIPQGCKLFYPVDYKGFLDDGVMYTDGDFTSLAKNEDITDSALNARGYYKMQDLLTAFGADGMVGGALRQQLAEVNNIDFRKTKCVKMADMPWLYNKNGYFMSVLNDREAGSLTMLCTIYGTGSGTGVASITDGQITSGTGNTNIYVIDTSCNGNLTAFSEKIKYQLFAYELAD